MQNLDIKRAENAWSSLSRSVFVPHTDAEYERLSLCSTALLMKWARMKIMR